ncbi:hypothetical protein KM043_006778 [Ampulex compressa]|nr:hypothetical protein KM043_006778 [Ampulex compressa]
MSSSSDGQSLSKMPRSIFLAALTLSVLIASCASEPTKRRLFVGASTKVDCAGQEKYSIVCSKGIDEERNSDNRGEVSRKSQQLEQGLHDVNEPEEVSARKQGKEKGYGKLLLLIGAAKATILYTMIHAVAAIAGKALIVAKVALAIAGAVALKKLFEHNDKVSYEIVKHPHHSFIQTHSSSVDYDHHGSGEDHYSHRKRRRSQR